MTEANATSALSLLKRMFALPWTAEFPDAVE